MRFIQGDELCKVLRIWFDRSIVDRSIDCGTAMTMSCCQWRGAGYMSAWNVQLGCFATCHYCSSSMQSFDHICSIHEMKRVGTSSCCMQTSVVAAYCPNRLVQVAVSYSAVCLEVGISKLSCKLTWSSAIQQLIC